MAKFPLETIRHSASHLMAAAVLELYPDVKFDIGPSTEDGFYYDFDFGTAKLTPEDLVKIEEKMTGLAAEKLPLTRFELTREEAVKLLTEKKQNFKLERLADIPEGEAISFYQLGNFVDLCRGPHVDNTGDIGAFKLTSIAGSYYRGKESNPMLTRIYGTAFSDKKELREYLRKIEEAKKRDHRKIGKELDLFSVSETVGPGLVLWHPRGALIRNLIETFWRGEHMANGYDLLYTPHIGRANLWETSGHLGFYKDSMYSPMEIDDVDYFVKPMNCPFHIEIYKSRVRSYRELPCRWAELGTVYRYEKSGVLHGLMRVRGFTQDDAHIICTPEQIESEIEEVLRFCLHIWKTFQFKEIKAYLSTRPEKAVGDPARWEQAQKSLVNAIEKSGLAYEVDEGGGAFYGPKIDLKVKDAIGREWQTSTIQFDFNLPERFQINYIGEDGQRHQPYMVHRALFGSLERFFGILIEHFAGAFPAWLAPEQVRLIPITERQHEYCLNAAKELRKAGFRVECDIRKESMGAKIKDARNMRIPFMAVVGDKEMQNNTFSIRSRREDQLGEMDLATFVKKLQNDVENKL
ncbi:MAG TPA: threonine--tRNA ligase [Lentisphaeria bacterium]|nr:threonine--tRNA ligase [Lentisphaeria bacterium]HCG48242.1 threonine--tRNA ligase [Lentisphaeria bacterium]